MCGKEIIVGKISVKIGSIHNIGNKKLIFKDGDLCTPCAKEAVKFVFKRK